MIFRTNYCRTNDLVPCRANYPTNVRILNFFFFTFLQISTLFYEFLHNSTNFYAFLRISPNFSKVLYFPRFLATNFYKFLHISTNFYDHSYKFLLFSSNKCENMSPCCTFHHRLNCYKIF